MKKAWPPDVLYPFPFLAHVQTERLLLAASSGTARGEMAGPESVPAVAAVTRDQLADEVDKIIASGGDPEAAHSREDALLHLLVSQYCPGWVKTQVDRLTRADFPRWYA